MANNENEKENDMATQRRKQLVQGMVDQVEELMEKLHVLVVGPGLGRCPLVLDATAQIIRLAQSKYRLPLVIDADALFLLTLPPYKNLLTSESNVVLTPNVMEWKRLQDSPVVLPTSNCCIIQKGAVDMVRPAITTTIHGTSENEGSANDAEDDNDVLMCDEEGGLKRSGGIGDILAGTCGTLVAWNRILSKSNDDQNDANMDLPVACWTACCFVKRATKRAFDKHRRSMTAPDVLEELGPTVQECENVNEE
jgi:ATP-dependent NAD(P)H-hydrate dehydratase